MCDVDVNFERSVIRSSSLAVHLHEDETQQNISIFCYTTRKKVGLKYFIVPQEKRQVRVFYYTTRKKKQAYTILLPHKKKTKARVVWYRRS